MDDGSFYVHQFDCSSWNSLGNFQREVANQLNFPDFYPRTSERLNLDSFNHCFGDAMDKDRNGLVLAFRHYDVFHNSNSILSQGILDVFQCNAWYHLFDGKYLVVLLQTDDSRLEIQPIGAVKPFWNSEESLYKNRGLGQ